MGGTRPRIKNQMAGAVEIKDNKAFIKNKSSEHATLAVCLKELITFDVWHDKHYVNRHQLGDDNGKRDGIGTEAVTALVTNSLKHLLFYSARIKGFTFLNHDNPLTETKTRIVLTDSFSNDIPLNVVIEAHFVNFNNYEITIVTAMQINGFKISSGQHAIDFITKDHSVLRKNNGGNMVEIYNCQD